MKKMYSPIEVNRSELTLMGVKFPDINTLESTANAIGTNMFEGFVPTKNSIIIIRDFMIDKISYAELMFLIKNKQYV